MSISGGSTNERSEPEAIASRFLDSPAITVDGLGKDYAGRAAVEALSFDVAPGEIFALLGPNGAGKTTTIEILEGYRAPDRGAARVLGLDPRRDHRRLMQRAGLMLQQGGIYPGIRVREVLDLFAHFYERPIAPRKLIEDLGLSRVADSRYRSLSGGEQQRLSLALALIGRPELVFLDEPTAGMDPQARRATWDIVRALKTSGVTVLLTTHFMDEAEELADRVAIIDQGHLVALDAPAALRSGGPITSIILISRAAIALERLEALPSALSARQERPGRYAIETEDPGALLVELSRALKQWGVIPEEIRIGTESLEDVFLRLTGTEAPS
jgi:ABC-2 type transport system ATP-binding protein